MSKRGTTWGRRLLTLALSAAMLLGLVSVPLTRTEAKAEEAKAVESPVIVKNGNGTYKVTFNYKGDENKSVGLVGSESAGLDWETNQFTHPMNYSDGVWSITLDNLQAGSHEYKFYVNDESLSDKYLPDPCNVLHADGNSNSLLYLGEKPLVQNDANNKGKYTVIFSYADMNGSVNSLELAGTLTWTNWDVDGNPAFSKAEGSNIWRLKMDNIEPGEFEYKFVKNQDSNNGWLEDPENPGGGQNCKLKVGLGYASPEIVGRNVTFRYKDDSAEKVKLAGTMTGWQEHAEDMAKGENDIWEITKLFEPGEHEYKFIVVKGDQENWVADPANPNVKEGGNSYFTISGDSIISPEVQGKQVTFRYKSDTAQSVLLTGSMNGWPDREEKGAQPLEKGENGIWELTLTPGAGRYEYKFLVDGQWTEDPVCPNKLEGGNGVFVIPGLAAPKMQPVKTGESIDLPEKLDLFAADGKSSQVTVTYAVKGEANGAKIEGTKLTVPKEYAGDTIAVTATYDQDTVDFDVKVVSTMYTYTIYFFDYDATHMTIDATDLWAWEKGKDGTTVEFTGTEEIGGKTWLKTEWKVYFDEIGMKARSKGKWANDGGWEMANDRFFSNAEKSPSVTLYIVNSAEYPGVYTEIPELPAEQGRSFYVPGTFPGPSWDAASNKMAEFDAENKIYSHTFENVPAGNYEFKIAVNGAWDPENYGVGGELKGGNYSVHVPKEMNVTVYYSDVSHCAVTSVDYEFLKLTVSGTGIDATALTDPGLSGIYSGKVILPAGTYADATLKNEDGSAVGTYPEFTLDADKAVTFYYAPAYKVWYCDAFAWDSTAQVKYDSSDLQYKDPYGAVPTDTDVTFALDTDSKITGVTLVAGGIQYPMTAEDTSGGKHWTKTVQFDAIGEYKYFFLIAQNGGIKVYSDDDGYYGTGRITELNQSKPYDIVVYEKGYETPDWMKDAVIYQIFPDRFFDGDESNNQAQTTARGAVNYEFPEWNLIPENPEQKELVDEATYKATGAFWGDGEWSNEMYGGDLKGITEKVEYLKSLGVTVIYLNPVFSSISNHRYDTSDYRKIDPILGSLEDFQELVKAANDNNMHLILDGVFNHVSDDSIYFDRYYKFLETKKYDTVGAYPYWAYVYDYMKEKSVGQTEAEAAAKEYFKTTYNVTDFRYTEWFDIFNKPMEGSPKDTIGLRQGKVVYSYDGWWGYDSMPVIKSTNGSEYQSGTWGTDVIDGDNSISRYWLRQGTDGWRLDVANEVSDETWQKFRVAVKSEGDNVIIGEIWDDATRYLLGDMYDSVMNYMFRNAVTAYAMGGSAEQAAKEMEKIRERYPEEAFYAMMNLVDSHDTSRIVSYLDGIGDDRNDKSLEAAFPSYEKTSQAAKDMQKLVAFLQFTYAGAPTVYYGDERGLAGGDDPDDRRTINWDTVADPGLLEWYTKLGNIRNEYSALRTGSVEPIEGTGANVLGYVRRDDAQTFIVVANNSASDSTVTLKLADLDVNKTGFDELIGGGTLFASDGSLTVTVPARRGVILLSNDSVPTPVVPSPAPSQPAVSTGDVTDEGETTTETTAKPSASVSGGAASATVSPSMGSEIVKQAEKNDSDTVVIAPEVKSDVDKAQVTIPANTVAALAEKTGADVRVETPVASVTIPNEALSDLGKAGKVTVTAEKTEDAVKVDITAGGKTVSEIPGGLKASFELGEGQVAVLMSEDGTETVIPKSVVEDGVTYVLLEGSATVKIVDARSDYADVAEGAWYEDSVDFASSHDLMTGTGEDTFEPAAHMSRAMLATVLWRLENKEDAEEDVTFPDVTAGQWYSDGVVWAAGAEIITGTGDGFQPDRDVTRQEMALMLYRYAAHIGLDTGKTDDLSGFNDSDSIDVWAMDAMRWAVSVGLLKGDGASLCPASGASRAEAAAVLERLIGLIVK